MTALKVWNHLIVFGKGPMHRKINLVALIAFSALFLTMCTLYDQSGAVISSNGLSCQNRTDFVSWRGQQSASCYYQCPDQTIRRPELQEKFSPSSPLYSASKEDLDAQFCGDLALQPTATESPATEPPVAQASASPTRELSATVSPTLQASPSATRETSATATPGAQASPSPTRGTSATSQTPLLTGGVTMCDLAVDLINFRMNEPVPTLNNRDLIVQIAGQETSCYVNEVNPSLLTCRIPASAVFPARVVVRLDNVEVNDFTYDGGGCAKIATPLPPLPAP